MHFHNDLFIIASPVLTTPSQNVYAALGDSVSLSCTSEGSPPDTFAWMKDGIELQSNINTASVTYTGSAAVFQSTYSISNFSSSDIGTYTCTVTNPIGKASMDISLDALVGKQVSMYTHARQNIHVNVCIHALYSYICICYHTFKISLMAVVIFAESVKLNHINRFLIIYAHNFGFHKTCKLQYLWRKHLCNPSLKLLLQTSTIC